jgi:hypothetical protein
MRGKENGVRRWGAVRRFWTGTIRRERRKDALSITAKQSFEDCLDAHRLADLFGLFGWLRGVRASFADAPCSRRNRESPVYRRLSSACASTRQPLPPFFCNTPTTDSPQLTTTPPDARSPHQRLCTQAQQPTISATTPNTAQNPTRRKTRFLQKPPPCPFLALTSFGKYVY